MKRKNNFTFLGKQRRLCKQSQAPHFLFFKSLVPITFKYTPFGLHQVYRPPASKVPTPKEDVFI